MTNRKGPLWETTLLKYLREHQLDAERLRLTGKEDEGDLVVKDGGVVIVEAKNEKKIDLAGYLREAEAEARSYAKHRKLDPDLITPVAIIKRRNHGAGQAYVVMTVDTFFDIRSA
jgi:Holliday junction resolvase